MTSRRSAEALRFMLKKIDSTLLILCISYLRGNGKKSCHISYRSRDFDPLVAAYEEAISDTTPDQSRKAENFPRILRIFDLPPMIIECQSAL